MTHVAPVYAMNQAVVKVRTRSLAVAIQLLVVNLFGLGLGPVVVGALNDALRPEYGDGAIRYTMMIAAVTHVMACVFYFVSARTVREDIDRQNAEGRE